MRESEIENYGGEQVKSLGGIPYKFTSPQRRNVPDRLNIFPQGVTLFIEYKATGKRASKGQLREIKRLRDRGCWVQIIDSKEGVDRMIVEVAFKILQKELA